MICKKCSKGKHGKCANTKHASERPTWCDCQHRAKPFDPIAFRAAIERLTLLPEISIRLSGKPLFPTVKSGDIIRAKDMEK